MATNNPYDDQGNYSSSNRDQNRDRFNEQKDSNEKYGNDNSGNEWDRNQQVNFNRGNHSDRFNQMENRPYHERQGHQQVNYIPDHDDRRYEAGYQKNQGNDYRYGMQPQSGSQSQNQSWNQRYNEEDQFRRSGFHAGYQQPYEQNDEFRERSTYGNAGWDKHNISGDLREDHEVRNYGDRRYTSDRFREERNERGRNERGLWDKTRDEVSSWFGDDDAERRRDRDKQRGEHSGKGPRGYQRSKERIMEDVCDRLTVDDRLDASDIEVNVDNNEVVLTGTVTSKEAKRRAEDLAEAIPGVRNVENRIKVVTPDIGHTETTNTIIRNAGNMREH